MVRMRINRSATGMRRSHHALKEPRLNKCPDCGAYALRHRACEQCGKYRGRQVIDVEAKQAKKASKRIAELEAKANQGKDIEKEASESVTDKTEKKAKTSTKKATKTASKSKKES